MGLLGMRGALAWNESPVYINEQHEWNVEMWKCEGKVRPPSGFPLRDIGNNPFLQPYLTLSLSYERTRRGQRCTTMCAFGKWPRQFDFDSCDKI